MNTRDRYKQCSLDEKRMILSHLVKAHADLGEQNKKEAESSIRIAVQLWGAEEDAGIISINQDISDGNVGIAKHMLFEVILYLIREFAPAGKAD